MKTKGNLSCTSLKVQLIELREHHKNSNSLDHRIEIILDEVHGLETNLDSQAIDIDVHRRLACPNNFSGDN